MAITYPDLSPEEELVRLKAASERLIESFKDPVRGDANHRDFLIKAGMLKKDCTPVRRFRTMFSPETIERLRKA